jgi:hypothetical protein
MELFDQIEGLRHNVEIEGPVQKEDPKLVVKESE